MDMPHSEYSDLHLKYTGFPVLDDSYIASSISETTRACSGRTTGSVSFTIERGSVKIVNNSLGGLIGAIQKVLDEWEREKGVTVDYIHDEKALEELARQKNSLAIFLPAMDKSDLFATVEKDGVFPKKSFSIGHARDKRYYLECRKIK